MEKEFNINLDLLSVIYDTEVTRFEELGSDDPTYEVTFKHLKNGRRYNIINIYELVYKKLMNWVINKTSFSIETNKHIVRVYDYRKSCYGEVIETFYGELDCSDLISTYIKAVEFIYQETLKDK